MAAVTSSAVTVNVVDTSKVVPHYRHMKVTVELDTQGGDTNVIPVSVLGLKRIWSVTNGVDGDNNIYQLATDGTNIYVGVIAVTFDDPDYVVENAAGDVTVEALTFFVMGE